MDLVSLETIKAVYPPLKKDPDQDELDQFLKLAIGAFSGAGGSIGTPAGAERFCNRVFEQKSYTQYFDLNQRRKTFQLRAMPVVSITTVHISADETYDSTTLIDAANYRVKKETGRLVFTTQVAALIAVNGLQVVYTGGFSTTTAGLPSDLQLAAALQVYSWRQHKDRPDLLSEGVQGGSFSRFSTDNYLKEVRQVLEGYQVFQL